MGIQNSANLKDSHIIHFMRFGDHKLYVYLPRQEKFYSFSVFQDGQKFRFFRQKSICLDSGSVYLIGGQTADSEGDQLLSPKEKSTLNLHPTNFVCKINLKHHKNFRVDISTTKPCPVLPEPRTSHLLVCSDQWIYVIGGCLENSVATQTCRKFHTKRKVWESVSSISFAKNVTELEGLAIKNFIYVFDTSVKSKLPQIHRYITDLDIWVEILFQQKNRLKSIPTSVISSLYQTNEDEILIFSNDEVVSKGFYYTFNTKTEEMSDITIDENHLVIAGEKQANLNYTDSNDIFVQLNEHHIKIFKKHEKLWVNRELTIDNNPPTSDFGCCSSRHR